MVKIIYPSIDKIIEYNFLVLEFIKIKKADQSKVLSKSKLREVLEACKEKNGDIYDKATVLLTGLVQSHAFASGNRRTAFVITKEFLLTNKAPFGIPNDPVYAKVLQGVREGYSRSEGVDTIWKN